MVATPPCAARIVAFSVDRPQTSPQKVEGGQDQPIIMKQGAPESIVYVNVAMLVCTRIAQKYAIVPTV